MVLPGRKARGGLGLACLFLMALLGLGGAAATPEGTLLGLPTPAAFAGLLAAAAALAWLAPGEAGSLGLGLAPFLLALPFAAWVPGLKAWTGPPLLALVLGTVFLAASKWLSRPMLQRALLPSLLAVYALAAWRVQVQVGPEGDEPHYLMVADSLLRDRDVSLEQDYAERRYLAFYQKGELAPHYRVRGRHGEIYSLHAVGLSLLVLPAYALGGYPAASFFMALLLGCLVQQLLLLIESWLGEAGPAAAVAWLVGLSPPLIHYAGLIFTEVPAALLLTGALRLGSEPSRLRGPRLLGLIAAIAFLPWLNVRYAVVAALLLLHALLGRPRSAAAAVLVVCSLLSAAALAAYHFTLYGFFDPRLIYGPRPELLLSQLPEGFPGLLFDQEFGLLAYAPVFALAASGLFLLVRERPRVGVVGLALVGSLALLAGAWHMWRGGFNPPARFLVPIVPILAVGVARSVRSHWSAPAALLAGWGLWVGLTGAWEPRLVHRDRDGTAPFFRAYSGAEEWTRLLPGYVLADPDRQRLAAVWAIGLCCAVLASLRGRRASAAGLAATSAAAIGLAVCASSLSRASSGGRDAVRVIGRRAIAIPRVRVFANAPARWTPEGSTLGLTYEPHRHPQGASIGERLDLPPGTYRLLIHADVVGEGLPDLLVWHDRDQRLLGRSRFRVGREGLFAPLEVQNEDGPVTLALQGGSPLILKEFRLERSTFAR